jgi:REP element-mobilizing transposase RayT
VPEVAEILVQRIIACRDKGAYLLHEFVVMPNHFHLLITPGETTSLEHSQDAGELDGNLAGRISRLDDSRRRRLSRESQVYSHESDREALDRAGGKVAVRFGL